VAECANKVGAFESIHDLLFEAGDSIGRQRWTWFALRVGIQDTVSFMRCFKDPDVLADIRRDVRAADSLGVTATPTFLINDQLVKGAPPLELLHKYIEAELARQRQ
jgi:protein-disulfide isomerase